VIAAVWMGIVGNFLLAVYALLLYFVLLAAKITVFYKSAKLLQQKPVIFLYPILEVCSPIFNLYVRIYRAFRGKNDYTFNIR
jgi:hypothetical protein